MKRVHRDPQGKQKHDRNSINCRLKVSDSEFQGEGEEGGRVGQIRDAVGSSVEVERTWGQDVPHSKKRMTVKCRLSCSFALFG